MRFAQLPGRIAAKLVLCRPARWTWGVGETLLRKTLIEKQQQKLAPPSQGAPSSGLKHMLPNKHMLLQSPRAPSLLRLGVHPAVRRQALSYRAPVLRRRALQVIPFPCHICLPVLSCRCDNAQDSVPQEEDILRDMPDDQNKKVLQLYLQVRPSLATLRQLVASQGFWSRPPQSASRALTARQA